MQSVTSRRVRWRGLPAAVLLLLCGHCPWTAAAAGGAATAQAAPQASEERRPEWLHIPASDLNIDFYLDRASVHVVAGTVEFWDVVVFAKPTQRDETSDRWIKEKRTLRRARCASGELALVRGASFDEGGHLIEAVTLPPESAQFSVVKPGTVAASELYRACREAGLDSPQVLPGSDSVPPSR